MALTMLGRLVRHSSPAELTDEEVESPRWPAEDKGTAKRKEVVGVMPFVNEHRRSLAPRRASGDERVRYAVMRKPRRY